MIKVLETLCDDLYYREAIDYIASLGGDVEDRVLSLLLFDTNNIEVCKLSKEEIIVTIDVVVGSYNTLLSIKSYLAWNKVKLTELPCRDTYAGILSPKYVTTLKSNIYVVSFSDLIRYHEEFSLERVEVNERFDIHLTRVNPILDIIFKNISDDSSYLLSCNLNENSINTVIINSNFDDRNFLKRIRMISVGICHSIDYVPIHTESCVTLFIYYKLLKFSGNDYSKLLYNNYRKCGYSVVEEFMYSRLTSFTKSILSSFKRKLITGDIVEYMLKHIYSNSVDNFINSVFIDFIIKVYGTSISDFPNYNGCWFANINNITVEEVKDIWNKLRLNKLPIILNNKEFKKFSLSNRNMLVDYNKSSDIYTVYKI